jgi:hypothetical protein
VYQGCPLLDLDQADVAVTVEIDKVGVPGPKSRLLADDNDLTEPDVLGRQELWVTRQDAVQVRLKGQRRFTNNELFPRGSSNDRVASLPPQ